MTTAWRALVVSAVAFTALTVLAVTDWVAGLDRRVTTWVFGWPGAWEGTMRTIWWLATRRGRAPVDRPRASRVAAAQPAVAMAAAALASWGLALATKQLVGRARPTTALLGGAPRDPLAGHGYPSAHAALAAALVVPVWFVALAWCRPILAFAVAVVAVSRVYSGAHFALDSLGGVALGVMCGVGRRGRVLDGQT